MNNPNPNIFLVDDDIDDLELMKQVFADAGISESLFLFSSWSSLSNRLLHSSDQQMPSLIVLDYNMPKVNGTEALRYLKSSEKFRHIPIIIYSTSCTPKMEKEVLELGALKCMQKARDLAGLRKHVQSFINTVKEQFPVNAQ